MINFLLGLFIGITLVNLTVLIYMTITDNECNNAIIGMGIYYWIIGSIIFIIRKIKKFIIKKFQRTIVLRYTIINEKDDTIPPTSIRFRDWKINLKNIK